MFKGWRRNDSAIKLRLPSDIGWSQCCDTVHRPWFICSKRSNMSGRTPHGRQQRTWLSCSLNLSLSPPCKKWSIPFNSNVHKINSCPRDYHLDSFNDSFDILIHLFIVHLVLSRVWDAYSHLKQTLWDLKPNILRAKKFEDPVTRLTWFWYVWI